MTSKELLSAVFTDEQQDFKVIGICAEDDRQLNYIWIEELSEWDRSGNAIREVKMSINVYELANKCKAWAWKKHLITIRSGIAENGAWSNLANDNSVSYCSMDIPLTEPEAIFMACQWILDNY